MKGDIFGRPLSTGDLVVIRVRGYRALQLAQVMKCTAKRVHVFRFNEDGTRARWLEQVQMAVFILKAAEATPEVIKLLIKKAKENE